MYESYYMDQYAYHVQHMMCRISKLTQPRNTQIKAWHVPWLINPLLELLVYIQTSNSSFIEMKLSKFSPLQTVIYSIHDDFGWNLIKRSSKIVPNNFRFLPSSEFHRTGPNESTGTKSFKKFDQKLGQNQSRS